MKRHNRLKKHTLGLAAALLVTAGMSQIALAGDSVYVNTSSLRYRTSAQIKDNNIAGNLSYGQKLERVGTSGQWTMILLNGKKYYVSSAYVTSKKPASAGAVQTTSQTAAGAQTSAKVFNIKECLHTILFLISCLSISCNQPLVGGNLFESHHVHA